MAPSNHADEAHIIAPAETGSIHQLSLVEIRQVGISGPEALRPRGACLAERIRKSFLANKLIHFLCRLSPTYFPNPHAVAKLVKLRKQKRQEWQN